MTEGQSMRRVSFLICSAILYVVACCLPALEFRRNEDGVEIWEGWITLLAGILGPLLGHFAGLANPLLVLAAGLLFFRKRAACIVCVILALLLGFETLTLFHDSIPGDEANVNKLYLRQLREGMFCWLGSMVVILVGAIFCDSKPVVEQSVKTS